MNCHIVRTQYYLMVRPMAHIVLLTSALLLCGPASARTACGSQPLPERLRGTQKAPLCVEKFPLGLWNDTRSWRWKSVLASEIGISHFTDEQIEIPIG